jgi:1-pyrroline-4-hydroxy-2-carboxylate deaminase
MNPNWKGVFPAVTTQFTREQELDLDATARHLEVLLDSGVTGIVMLGSLGENVTLSPEEKRQVMRTALEVCGGRVPVLSGVAENSTRAAVQYVQEMEKMGADGVMVLPAMIYKAAPLEALTHFQTVARSTNLPIICYNNPLAYYVDIDPKMFAILADEENIVAIKESSGDVRRITDIFNEVGNRYTIFGGVDDLIMESVLLGAEGWIAGMGLAFPKENQRLWELMTAGEWTSARELYRWYTPLLHLDIPLKFVQYIKLAIQECGLGAEWVRAPRLPLTGTEREEILAIIHKGIETRPQI